MPENSAAPWFALTVKPRHEKAVENNLHFHDLEAWLPLYPARRFWSDRIKTVDLPLFPGYVFCRINYAARLAVLNTPGVTSIVGFNRTDVPVEDSEIAAIQAILRSGLPVGPWPYLRPGARVRIGSGPLTGLEGTLLREKGVWRIVVGVELLQRSVAVEIDREFVCAVDAPPPALHSSVHLNSHAHH